MKYLFINHYFINKFQMGSTCTCFESNDNKQNMETNMFQNNISKNIYT